MPKQNVALELYYSGAWHDIAATSKVFADAPITIRRGLGDESGGWPRPAQISARLDNADDSYRTSNPESALYGLAGRNTPMRASVGGSVRGIVEASSWTADQSRDFRETPRRGRAWVDVAGGGLLQRIGQWTQPLRSPFYTYNMRIAGLAGYFPMEDARGSTRAVSAVDGATNSVLYGVSFDSQQRPPGSAPLADIVSTTSATGIFRFTGGTADDNSGWQFSVCQYMSALDALTSPMNVRTRNGGTAIFSLLDSTNDANLNVTDASGATLINTTVNYGSYQWEGRWLMINMVCSVSGGTVTIEVSWRAADEIVWQAFSGTYSGITSSVDNCRIGGIPGFTVGHILATNGRVNTVLDEDRFTAFLGHPGELAAVRFGRLIDETLGSGNYYVSSGWASSMPMGPQPVAALPDLIKECITTEDAIVYDYGSELKLYFLCRADRYNQTPALELVPTDLTVLPKEVTDDKNTANIVTASQRDGGDWTAEDSTGPLGSQPPPDGAGEAKQTVDVNLDDPDAQLPQVANWWLRKGTVDLPRFPQLTVDLNANPGLIADVESIAPGNVITLTGFRENVIRLYVLGWTETIGTHSRTITFVCAPDQQFVVGEYDSTSSRYDLRSSTLTFAKSPGVTAMTFQQTSDETWSTSTPYDVFIAGERLTITSMGARSGTGPWTQSVTATRSVNGISKTLPAGSEVHIATPGRWAL